MILREIRRYQKTYDFFVSKLFMRRLMREIAQDFQNDIRFQKIAINVLQKATKSMLIE